LPQPVSTIAAITLVVLTIPLERRARPDPSVPDRWTVRIAANGQVNTVPELSVPTMPNRTFGESAMSKTIAAAVVVVVLLVIQTGCGWRRACCSCEPCCSTASVGLLSCPLPPPVPACDGYVAELPPEEPLRISQPSDDAIEASPRPQGDAQPVPRSELEP
jgi:hypothetical protein